MINAVHYDKPLIFTVAIRFEFIKAVSDTVYGMINAVNYDKPLIFTMAIRSSLSRLLLTLYYGMINAVHYDQPLILSELRYGRKARLSDRYRITEEKFQYQGVEI